MKRSKEGFLQIFAEAVSGRRLVYLYRILSEAATQNGTQIAFTTENERTKSKDADSTSTKDGSIRTPGTAEIEITATRSEEHTSELQSRFDLVCRLLLEKKKTDTTTYPQH